MPPSKAPIQEGPADRRQLLLIIKNKYGALSRASKTIADFILAHHDEAIYLNIRQMDFPFKNLTRIYKNLTCTKSKTPNSRLCLLPVIETFTLTFFAICAIL